MVVYLALLVEKRQLVVPGEMLAEGDYLAGDNTYEENGKIYSQKLGLVEIKGKKVSVVALRGPYIPKVGDLVIGQIVDVTLGGWLVDINSPYTAILSTAEATGRAFNPKMVALTKILTVGDILIAKVTSFDRTRDPALTIRGQGLGKVGGGVIINLTPTKVPRLIGRKGSMISMIKQLTGCNVIVGQNGRILIRGKDLKMMKLTVEAVRMVEKQAHISGLTDKIRVFLENSRKNLGENQAG
jgi:exosome complex component RRP4